RNPDRPGLKAAPLPGREHLEHLLAREFLRLILQFVVSGLLVDEDLVGQLERLVLEDTDGQDVLIALQQAIEEMRAAFRAEPALGPLGCAVGTRHGAGEPDFGPAMDREHGATRPAPAHGAMVNPALLEIVRRDLDGTAKAFSFHNNSGTEKGETRQLTSLS